MSYLNLNHNYFKYLATENFFITPADNNYLLARMCWVYQLDHEFWWQALQCLEKLLKSIIVLNGGCSKQYSHNISDMWRDHVILLKDMAVPILLYHDETEFNAKKFVDTVNSLGSVDSRYGQKSFVCWDRDLNKLDILYKEIRRRAVCMEWVVGEDWDDNNLSQYCGLQYSELIRSYSDVQARHLKVPSGNINVAGDDLSDIFYASNVAFRRSVSENRSINMSIFRANNSFIYLLLEELSCDEFTEQAKINLKWMVENIRLESEVKKFFNEKLNNIKTKTYASAKKGAN